MLEDEGLRGDTPPALPPWAICHQVQCFAQDSSVFGCLVALRYAQQDLSRVN